MVIRGKGEMKGLFTHEVLLSHFWHASKPACDYTVSQIRYLQNKNPAFTSGAALSASAGCQRAGGAGAAAERGPGAKPGSRAGEGVPSSATAP